MNVLYAVFAALYVACGDSTTSLIHQQLGEIDWRDANKIVQFAFGLKEQFPTVIETNPFFQSLFELSVYLVHPPLKGEDLVPQRLQHTIRFLESPDVLESILSDDRGRFLHFLSLLRLVSLHVKSITSNQGIFKTACAVSYRYKSSTLSAVESQWNLFSQTSALFPIASRVRDISITRDRCVEDSALSILSIIRSVKQLTAPELLGSELYTFISNLLRDKIGAFKLFGIKQPILDLVLAISIVSHSTHSLQYAFPATKKRRVSTSPVFGFDCDNNEQRCEVQTVIDSFTEKVSLPLAEGKGSDLHHLFRNEFQFLQSVNANWFKPLSIGWGSKLSSALIGLANSTVAPRAGDNRCHENELKTFMEYVINTDDNSTGKKLAFAISELFTVPGDCSIALSAITFLIMDVLVQISSKTDTPLPEPFREDDIGELLEIGWQTIAGERFDVLLSSPVPMFHLMKMTWSRI